MMLISRRKTFEMASNAPLKILHHIHPGLETLDTIGPLDFLSHAKYDSGEYVFSQVITAVEEFTLTSQKLELKRHLSLDEAYATLADFDILVIPGGSTPGVLEGKTEPLQLIKAFWDLPRREDGRVRTLFSVCTGSLFLAEAGVLDGLTATTHFASYDRLRNISASKGKTTVVEERFVVNKVDEAKGLRVITSGGVSAGLDAAAWLIGEIAGQKSKGITASHIEYAVRDGLVV
ncbi:class I glutamine amidotransferase-like protein [Bisporella sp. PMI_857]|nr:class I glutamine amidotransferase-like protein [Bisporella sp. PMI_857]